MQNFYVHSALSIQSLESVIAVGAGSNDGLNALGLESLDVGVGSFAELMGAAICIPYIILIDIYHYV